MSKYIIEIPDDVQYVLLNGKADGKYYTAVHPVAELEILNSDYINEHYGSLQDEAYQAGMDKAWEATKKIFGYEIDGAIPIADIGNVFGYEPCKAFCTADILRDFTVQEAIAKLKAYDDGKLSDRIEVGDEVATETGIKYTVVSFGHGGTVCGFNAEGKWTGWKPKEVTKTGKHYDIQSILEAMRE